MKCFASLICAASLLAAASDAGASTDKASAVRARRIAQRIGEMQKADGKSASDLEICVRRDAVTVLADIKDLEDARFVLEAILAEPGVKVIQLECASSLVVGGNEAVGSTPSEHEVRARRIAQRIGEVQNTAGKQALDVEIRVKSDTCRVLGSINDAEDSRQVLEAILAEPNVQGIQLTLGVGSEAPSWPPVRLQSFYGSGTRKLDWDNRHWQEIFQLRGK